MEWGEKNNLPKPDKVGQEKESAPNDKELDERSWKETWAKFSRESRSNDKGESKLEQWTKETELKR